MTRDTTGYSPRTFVQVNRDRAPRNKPGEQGAKEETVFSTDPYGLMAEHGLPKTSQFARGFVEELERIANDHHE